MTPLIYASNSAECSGWPTANKETTFGSSVGGQDSLCVREGRAVPHDDVSIWERCTLDKSQPQPGAMQIAMSRDGLIQQG